MRTPTPTREQCAARLGCALQQYMRNTKTPRKVLARVLGENHRTIDGWITGGHIPPIHKLPVLMAVIPEVCDEIMALVAEAKKVREGNNSQ